ncbi:major facilitator superfamily domain-containing protein [Xylogone sp. PMI_703]|nr:major facilitator superfamily domain-containing protein [Xylogone sp. PMI_703]
MNAPETGAKPTTPIEQLENTEFVNDDKVKDQVVIAEPEDPEMKALERKLKWKLDLFILPLISAVYFFASMGRSDLGNAEVAGMEEELSLSPEDYSNAATTFLVGYIAFQLPGTVLLKSIGPQWQFGGAMLLWGLFTTLTVLVSTAGSLQGMRFLIGFAEAFVQGAVFYLSFWYTYKEIATRGAIVFSTSALAGAFNGLISYGIATTLDGRNGWRAWRWIFLIEGIMPMAFSFVVFALLPPTPRGIRFGFTQSEIELAEQRSLRSHNSPDAKLEWKKIPTPLLEIHFWLITIMGCCGHFCLSSLSNFLPVIIRGFGYSSVNSQLFTVIVYACAFIGILLWSRIADVTNARGLTLVASSFLGVLGYALLIGLTNNVGRLVATCIVAFSIYPNVVLTLSWMTISIAGYTKRYACIIYYLKKLRV